MRNGGHGRSALAGALCLGILNVAAPLAAQTPVATAPAKANDGWRSWADEAAAPAVPAASPTPGVAPAKARPRPPVKPRARPAGEPKVIAPVAAEAVPAPEPRPTPSLAAPAPAPAPVALPAPAPAAPAPAPAPVVQVFVVLEPMTPAQLAALTAGKPPGARPVVVGAPVLLAGPMPPGGPGAAPAEARVEGRADAAPAPAAPAKPAPPPYSLPWQLRPATLANVARFDTVLATDREDDGKPSVTQVATLLVSRKLTPGLMPLLRLGAARTVPASGASSRVLLNPLLGLMASRSPRPGLHTAGFFALTPPVGSGGGNDATLAKKTALKNGGNARSAMDGAMVAVNDLGVLLGGDLAYLRGGATFQLEATLIQLHRMRGERAQADANRTNLTTGLHAGYFLLPQLSLGTELRYQRWLSTPAAVAADRSGDSRDTVTLAAGARLHVKMDHGWVRPGLSVSTALDAPLSRRKLTVVQIDLPVAF